MKKIFLVFIFFLITGCSYDPYEMPKEVNIRLNKNEFEVYSTKYIKDLIKNKNVEIINNNKKINTNKIGTKNTIIEYTYKKRKYKYKVKYEVIDSEKPIFISYLSNRTILLNDDIDFCKKISYADNYDRNVKCKIEGDIDNANIGTYDLKYVLTDQSNNVSEENLTVNVVESIYENNSYNNSTNINFSDVISKYKNDNTLIGIDVSAWQGNIDFEKIKESGCEFVIIRMAYSSNINENLQLDKYFKDNIKNAKNANLKVGIYFYTNAATTKEVRKQAKYILKHLKNYKLDFPIGYDFESWSNFNDFNLNTHDLDNLFITFKDIVNKKGYDAMIYSSKYYLEKVWVNKDNNKVWLAHYTDNTDYGKDYILWQMGNTGRINGIFGDVDIDIYYKRELN